MTSSCYGYSTFSPLSKNSFIVLYIYARLNSKFLCQMMQNRKVNSIFNLHACTTRCFPFSYINRIPSQSNITQIWLKKNNLQKSEHKFYLIQFVCNFKPLWGHILKLLTWKNYNINSVTYRQTYQRWIQLEPGLETGLVST